MSRERCLDSDHGGLAVAHLTDHQDVGVGPQQRAQRRSERQACPWVDLHLTEALDAYLDRVLDGDDVSPGVVDLLERRVQRRRLPRTRRAGQEDSAVWSCDRVAVDE